jgi:hypothetical protein
MVMKKPVIVLGLFLLSWTGSLAVLTWLDVNSFFLYLPRGLFYLGACALVFPFVPGKYWRVKICLAGALLAWLLLLPSMRWTSLKSFYIDCSIIKPGMTVDDARAVMTPYVEVDSTNDVYSAYMPGVAETPVEHNTRILFIPTEADSADWCVVYPEEQKVKAVVISPD